MWPSSMLDSVFEEDEIPFNDFSMLQFLNGDLCMWDRPKKKGRGKSQAIFVEEIG